ncbi:MAG: hypothetical protein LBS60_05470 [Deltaproteobacteria bacterium]|jgi:hypothetical protein|nr:hypothetical protein [Deltaproteobacteria bacterium]
MTNNSSPAAAPIFFLVCFIASQSGFEALRQDGFLPPKIRFNPKAKEPFQKGSFVVKAQTGQTIPLSFFLFNSRDYNVLFYLKFFEANITDPNPYAVPYPKFQEFLQGIEEVQKEDMNLEGELLSLDARS